MTDLVGRTIGRYHILEQLGEGGMAIVYKALDTTLDRHVAVKVIRNDIFGSTILERLLTRFRSEGRTLAKLSHPNIVPILDYGDFEGIPFLVMPFIPGGTLKGRLKKHFSFQDASKTLLPIAHALAHAHQQGIIHRDVKPSNILVTKTGEPMLSDFGVSKVIASEETRDITNTGTGVGTPEYMAPEQALGHVDERVDIYALGVVLYELITGRRPFEADTPMAVMLKKSTEPLPRPRQYVASLPDWVENVMVKSLAREPRNRYHTMAEFASALEEMTVGIKVEEKKKRTLLPTGWTMAFIVGIIVLGMAGMAVGKNGFFKWITGNNGLGNSATPQVSSDLTLPAVVDSPKNTPTDRPTATPTSTWQQGGIVFVARNASGVYFLYRLDLAQVGEPQLLLSPDHPKQSRYYAPWLSADGSKLAFDDFILQKMFLWDLNLSSGPWQVGDCASPSFSPDSGQVICYIRGGDYFPVYDADNGSLVNRIYHNMSEAVLPAWSPDGTEVAFSVLEEGRGQASVWKINVGGGDPIPLATEGYEDYAPSWSPDSEWVAYQSTFASDVSEVWIMRRDGSAQKQITFNGGDIWSRGPCFSPDGQWLAFVSSQNGTDGPDFGEVFVVSLLTGEVTQVTDTGGYVLDWRVTWSR